MPAATREQTFASGQLDLTAATVIAGSSVPPGTRLDVILHNTSSVTQEVVLTFQVAGATAVRLARGVLAEDEQMVVTGLRMQADDTLLGVTTSSGAVDYLVMAAGQFEVRTLDARGTPRQELTNASTTETIEGRSSTPVHDDAVRRAVEELSIAVQGVAGAIGAL